MAFGPRRGLLVNRRAFAIGDLFFGEEAGAWYDPSDLSTLFQDAAGTTPVTTDSDPVGLMLDISGNGNHVSQAMATKRPLYKTSGGLHWLEFDGIDDFLRATFTIAQPWERVSAFRQVSWTSGSRMYSGGNANNGILYQWPTTPTLTLYSGADGPTLATLAVGADGVVTERHSGASSRVALNNGSYATGNAGTSAAGGITIGANYDDGNAGAMRLYGLIIREGTMGERQMSVVRNHLAAKSGVSL